MHPFRTLPDQIDGVACGRCGHAVWDHCISEPCAECENRGSWSACNGFKLAGFRELKTSRVEEAALQQ